ncbi:MAG: YjgP/YjgQ family permease [Chlorobiaceae bacterium]|nr:YjgP/YjgQ family permease [Chlorobiaceae bacterium]
MKILDRYILKAHFGSFIFAFVTIIFVFVLTFLTKFLDRLIGKGLDFGVIVEVVVLQSAWMVGFAVPMAILVSTVMAFGGFANSSELTVMRSGGISVYRLVAPVMLAALVLSLLMERFNNVMMPEANFRANVLFTDISRMKPGLGIEENAFSDVIKGYSIMVRDIDDRTGELHGLVLYDRARPEVRSVILASKGMIEFTSDYRYLVLTLQEGQIHELVLPAMERYRKMEFSKHRYVFEATGYGFERTDQNSRKRGGKELSASDLLATATEFQTKSDAAGLSIRKGIDALEQQITLVGKKPSVSGSALVSLPPFLPGQAIESIDGMIGNVTAQIDEIEKSREAANSYMVEYHKKYSLAFACLAFAMVGAPLGVMARRGGFGAGAALSLFFFVLYWVLMIGGEKIAGRGLLSPAISVWLPNVVLAGAGSFLLYRLASSTSGSGR